MNAQLWLIVGWSALIAVFLGGPYVVRVFRKRYPEDKDIVRYQREVYRVNLDFTPEALTRLNEIRKESGAATRAKAVSNALRLYEWYINLPPDTKLRLVNKDGTVKEIEFKF